MLILKLFWDAVQNFFFEFLIFCGHFRNLKIGNFKAKLKKRVFSHFFNVFPNRKPSKIFLWPKRVDGSLRICLRKNLVMVEFKSDPKKINFLQFFSFKFQIFKFQKRPQKIKNSKKKFCASSRNSFKLIMLEN